jgi:hypothetical protein
MALFVVIVLGPACLFFLYALVQFWREAKRLRCRPESRLPRCVTPVTSYLAGQCDYSAHRTVGSEENKGIRGHDVVVITRPLSRRSVERDVA